MGYKFTDHTRCCIYNDQIIFLNLKTDEYIFIPKKNSIILKDFILSISTNNDRKQINPKYQSFIDELENLKLIELSDNINIKNIAQEKKSTGSFNLDWQVEENIFKQKIKLTELIFVYLVMIYVHTYLYFYGFYKLISKLEIIKPKNKSFYTKDNKLIARRVATLNKAAFLYPKRVKCLEWAIILTIILLKDKQKACLNIGVQNQPFASHAWVDIEGEIIADDLNLPNDLGIILNAPSY